MEEHDEFVSKCNSAIFALREIEEDLGTDYGIELSRIKGKIDGVKLAKQYYQELKKDNLI
jgi:hypothetical protein